MTSLPAIPTGWFLVAYSDELGRGELQTLSYFDRELVLWRDAAGAAHVFDAFCPHLGAHLGYGGTVDEDRLVCPFHGWQFDGDGVCRHVPYATAQPSRVATSSYPVDEHSGLLLVWYDPHGRPPTWRVPEIVERDDDQFTRDRRERWTIATSWFDIAENSVDVAHFAFVHGTPAIPSCSHEDLGWMFRVRTEQKFTTALGVIDGAIQSDSYGPGIGVVRFSGPVDLCMVPSITPIDAQRVDVRFSFMIRTVGDEDLDRRIQEAFVEEIRRQMSEDIVIWEHKRFIERPALCRGDGPIREFRKWATQFDSGVDTPTNGDQRSGESLASR